MQPARFGIHQRRQRVDVGAAQLLELALLQDDLDDALLRRAQLVAVGRQRFERVDGGAVMAGRRLLQPARREAHFVEEHLAQLLRAADVEVVADDLVERPLQLGQALRKGDRHLGEKVGVEQHAGHLHVRQHGQQRPLDGRVELVEPCCGQLRRQQVVEADRGVDIGAAVGSGLVDRHLVDGDLLAPATDELGQLGHRPLEPRVGQRLQPEGAAGGVEQPRHEQRVVDRSLYRQPVTAQHGQVVLGVVRDLGQRRVGKEWLQFGDNLAPVELRARCVRHRDVGCFARCPGDAEPDQRRLHGIGAGRFHVVGEAFGAGQRLRQFVQRSRVLHDEQRPLTRSGRRRRGCGGRLGTEECHLAGFVVGGRRRAIGDRQLLDQAAKLEFVEEGDERVLVVVAQAALVGVEVDVEIGVDGDQAAIA